MIRSFRNMVLAAFCLIAMMLSATHPACALKSEKRCYTVQETYYKIHDLKVTPEIKPIKHCYSDKDHPYRYSIVDIPVSLAKATVHTPEFAPTTYWYWILVQVEKPLPTEKISCMMAVDSDSPQSLKDCPMADRLLRADWSVLEQEQVVQSGSSTTHSSGIFDRDHIFKFLGGFSAVSGHKYVVEVNFTKDGTPLNLANPHLIVVKQGSE